MGVSIEKSIDSEMIKLIKHCFICKGHRKRALGSIDGPTRKRIHHSSRPMPSNGSTTAGDPDIDINEPTYCYCKQVSFGDMIACDGENVIFKVLLWMIFTDNIFY